MSILLGICGCGLSYLLSHPLLAHMHLESEIFPLTRLYLNIYFLSIPAVVIYNFGSALLRAIGDTFSPLLFILISGALNVGLNLLLVITFQMDVAGVALATTVSQTLSALLVILRLRSLRTGYRLEFRKIRLFPAKALRILQVGSAVGLQGLVFSISNVMIQSQINSFGGAVMAGNIAASSLEGIVHTAQNSFYQSALTFTSQAIGAGKKQEVKRIFRVNMLLTIALGLVMCALLWLFRFPLLRIYISPDDPAYQAVIAAGLIRIASISCFQWVGGMMETACGSLRGLGLSLNPSLTTLLCACLLRAVWIYTVFAHFGTIRSLYISYPISWILTLSVHLFYWYRYTRKMTDSQKGTSYVSIF